MNEWIGSGAVIFLTVLCLKLTNGINRHFNKFVHKDECHRVQVNVKEIINQRIDDLDKHLCERFDDLKDLMRSE